MVTAWTAAQDEVAAISTEVQNRPLVALGGTNVFADPGPIPFASSGDLLYKPPPGDERGKRINEELNQGLDRLMQESKDVFLIGEDVADPYGGAFKVTRGLSTKYPDQVLSSPISEAAIVGFGNGAALAGARPIVEIMFGDFVTLAVDQLVNQAAKMRFMYAGQAQVPLTVRLVSGGYRGYGATHSQSLEAMLCGIPGLGVVALSRRHDPGALLRAVVLEDDDPVVFVENKQIYAERPHVNPPDGFCFEPNAAAVTYPNLHFSTDADDADMTVVTYGGLTDQVEAAMTEAIVEDELDFEYFILTRLHPLHVEDIAASVRRTRKLLVIEEGPAGFGVGSEIVAQIHQALNGVQFSSRREGAMPVPIPSSRLQELEVLSSTEKIIEAIVGLSRTA
jgi:pyruvate/2-oxoglutarate/acetoin dehydrogenase E1 component